MQSPELAAASPLEVSLTACVTLSWVLEIPLAAPHLKRRGRGSTAAGWWAGALAAVEALATPVAARAVAASLLRRSGLFAGAAVGPGCIDEAALWLTALMESSCFRCCCLYFVGLLRLASERRLGLLAYSREYLTAQAAHRQEGTEADVTTAAAAAAATAAAAAAAGPGAVSGMSSFSVFSLAVLSHLSVTPRSNGGRPLFVEMPPFGVGAPRDSCWGCCSPMHADELCAAAVAEWAVQGFMRCCLLRPSWGPPFLNCLEAEGPWRVVGAALNVGASAKQEQKEQQQQLDQQQQQQQQTEATRAAAAQHPQYEAVNKYRRRLRRFLKVCCRRGVGPDGREETEGDRRRHFLDEQLALLSDVAPRLSLNADRHGVVHAVAPERLLSLFGAQLPGAQGGTSGGPAAMAGWSNGLGLLQALVQHIGEVLLTPCRGEDGVAEAGEVGGEQTIERLSPLLLQLETVTRHMRDAAEALGALVQHIGEVLLTPCRGEDGVAEAGEVGGEQTVERLSPLLLQLETVTRHMRDAAEALGGLPRGTPSLWAASETAGAAAAAELPLLLQNGRQKKRKEEQKGNSSVSSSSNGLRCFTEALRKWTEMGAVLSCHTANLLRAAAAEGTRQALQMRLQQQQQQLLLQQLQRLLRRAIELAAALVRAEQLLNPDSRAPLLRCMHRLGLAPRLRRSPAEGQNASGQLERETKGQEETAAPDEEKMETQQQHGEVAGEICQREEPLMRDLLLATSERAAKEEKRRTERQQQRQQQQ
ncbi:uncharacterized protein EMH_0016830 [Eimeria mitis]|uniref:Uncharacterized protein n=1 Tax=Eimeria mitis TaxID=44415 RepID=U6K6P1_9EIME|nr:uncharacterized protein EMH_0016830 [Eimeria mitis]CDJ33639.1 hypothetical protein EMH_0016830 [Eimeria mitis]